MLVALATRKPEAIRHGNLVQSSLTLPLGSVEPLELRQGKGLELDCTARHGTSGMCLLVYAPSPSPCAE